MTTAHRSIDGTSLHPGFIETCAECAPTFESGKHSPEDHHPFYAPDFYTTELEELCICGQRDGTDIHAAPYCQDCVVPEPDPLDFGAPPSFWVRIYSRLVARFGRRY